MVLRQIHQISIKTIQHNAYTPSSGGNEQTSINCLFKMRASLPQAEIEAAITHITWCRNAKGLQPLIYDCFFTCISVTIRGINHVAVGWYHHKVVFRKCFGVTCHYCSVTWTLTDKSLWPTPSRICFGLYSGGRKTAAHPRVPRWLSESSHARMTRFHVRIKPLDVNYAAVSEAVVIRAV